MKEPHSWGMLVPHECPLTIPHEWGTSTIISY